MASEVGLSDRFDPVRAGTMLKRVSEQADASQLLDSEFACAHGRAARISWGRLLKWVFEIDLEFCPNGSGELKIILAIVDQPVIEKILTHLGLQARAPPRAPARGSHLHAA